MRRSTAYLIVAVIIALAVGITVGVHVERVMLPTCEEDEFLYPGENGKLKYEGPGKADAKDYICVQFENDGNQATLDNGVLRFDEKENA